MKQSEPRWQFWIDVGGTFTDCIALGPGGHSLQHKTLSSGVVKGVIGPGTTNQRICDARRDRDPSGIWNGYSMRLGSVAAGQCRIRRSLGAQLLLDSPLVRTPSPGDAYELFSDEPAPLVAIRYLLGLSRNDPLPPIDVRLGTTRGTNALVTRSGSRTALVTTHGFRDLLRIGYQTRPQLFALEIRKPDELYTAVIEIVERIDAEGNILKACSVDAIRNQLLSLRTDGIDSLAICLLHACANPAHEQLIARIAYELGFENISVSHEVSSLRKIVPRGDTTLLDAYLNPVLNAYIQRILTSLHPNSRLQLMTSSGGLADADHFRGKDSILSGPAGGVVGIARVAELAGFGAAIGFDMGGTSTDVSRWAGEFELEYETEKAGVRVVTAMMAIETVAAGGGSLCHFDGVKLTVGPASAGADPGPACYGANGPLAVTDINFYLGKILPDAFPFDLDRAAVHRHLTEQCQQIEKATGKRFTPLKLADGYLRIANTNMVEAIRCVTVDRGIDPRDDVLVAFGGAAGQHACAVASELGMSKILMHPNAGILSAMGIGLAAVAVHKETGIYQQLKDLRDDDWNRGFASLREQAVQELKQQHSEDLVAFVELADLRFNGLDEAISIVRPGDHDFQRAYEETFQSRNGYLPQNRSVEVVTLRVTATANPPSGRVASQPVATKSTPTPQSEVRAYFDAKEVAAQVFDRGDLVPGNRIEGPAVITEDISTTVVDPGWRAEVLSQDELLLTIGSGSRRPSRTLTRAHRETADTSVADPVLLEVFNKRFEAIATQMGSTLRKISRSVNVKERLDYSCAVFTKEGDLVVNAPHIPVHLGAMASTVRYIVQSLDLVPGDVVVTNDPYRGGSHLPDVTLVTPVHDHITRELLFLTASRAHHAEIGGIAPGSMPAFSRNLAEEGVLIRATKVIEAGASRLESLQAHLASTAHPSRDPEMNIADIGAQIAANRQGAEGLLHFVKEYSWVLVDDYMHFIQQAAEQKMRTALRRLPDGTRSFTDHLDDGSPISVKLEVSGDTATLDFTGTGPVLPGNLNANRAIVTAAVMYCLRCLIDEEIPLNQGVLAPVTIELPECLLNPPAEDDPRQCAAIAGGNVETSQRVVDVVLGAFGVAAASQGTMNNFLFGDATFGYYETVCGGAGATRNAPGADAVHTHMTNTRLTDPEVLESRFPVRLRRFQIRRDSGGDGAQRGGDGVIREMEFLKPMHVSLLTQRRGEFAPYGVDGGARAATGRNLLITADGATRLLDGIASLEVKAGDLIRLETPGGGGWGLKSSSRE